MAVTQIADLLIREEFANRVQQLSTEKSALFQSGIIATDPIFNQLARGEGVTFTLPYWSDISGDSDVASDSPTDVATPAKIGTGSEIAVKLFRSKSWSAMDLTKSVLGGEDPMERIAGLISGWWTRDQQAVLIKTLTGAFTTALSSTHVHDVTGGSTALTDSVILDGKQLLGDSADSLSAIVMHSAKYTALQKAALIDYIGASADVARFPAFMGYRVIVDDSVPVANGNYTTYLFGPGAVAYGEGMPKSPTAYTRNELAGNGSGQETITTRREYIFHPRGLKWTGNSMAGSSPTNTELATGANWSKAWDTKNIRIIKILSK